MQKAPFEVRLQQHNEESSRKTQLESVNLNGLCRKNKQLNAAVSPLMQSVEPCMSPTIIREVPKACSYTWTDWDRITAAVHLRLAPAKLIGINPAITRAIEEQARLIERLRSALTEVELRRKEEAERFAYAGRKHAMEKIALRKEYRRKVKALREEIESLGKQVAAKDNRISEVETMLRVQEEKHQSVLDRLQAYHAALREEQEALRGGLLRTAARTLGIRGGSGSYRNTGNLLGTTQRRRQATRSAVVAVKRMQTSEAMRKRRSNVSSGARRPPTKGSALRPVRSGRVVSHERTNEKKEVSVPFSRWKDDLRFCSTVTSHIRACDLATAHIVRARRAMSTPPKKRPTAVVRSSLGSINPTEADKLLIANDPRDMVAPSYIMESASGVPPTFTANVRNHVDLEQQLSGSADGCRRPSSMGGLGGSQDIHAYEVEKKARKYKEISATIPKRCASSEPQSLGSSRFESSSSCSFSTPPLKPCESIKKRSVHGRDTQTQISSSIMTNVLEHSIYVPAGALLPAAQHHCGVDGAMLGTMSLTEQLWEPHSTNLSKITRPVQQKMSTSEVPEHISNDQVPPSLDPAFSQRVSDWNLERLEASELVPSRHSEATRDMRLRFQVHSEGDNISGEDALLSHASTSSFSSSASYFSEPASRKEPRVLVKRTGRSKKTRQHRPPLDDLVRLRLPQPPQTSEFTRCETLRHNGMSIGPQPSSARSKTTRLYTIPQLANVVAMQESTTNGR